jgi:hypothetical protein
MPRFGACLTPSVQWVGCDDIGQRECWRRPPKSEKPQAADRTHDFAEVDDAEADDEPHLAVIRGRRKSPGYHAGKNLGRS